MGERTKLTGRQQEVYDFILECIRTRGYGPTVRDIGKQFDIKSPNGVMCHLQALQKKGLIKREGRLSRAITIVDDENRSGQVRHSPNPHPNLRSHDLEDRSAGIPLAGTIAAGKPIEAFEQNETIDFSEMFQNGEFYALRVRGNSMIEDHIEEGDYVIIRKQETATDGQTVVALVDDSETTLKRFYREKTRFRLEPANGEMEPIYSTNVKILGVLVGLVRNFSPRR